MRKPCFLLFLIFQYFLEWKDFPEAQKSMCSLTNVFFFRSFASNQLSNLPDNIFKPVSNSLQSL